MILLLSSPTDPVGSKVAEELTERGADFAFVSVHDIPRSVRLELFADGRGDSLHFPDGSALELERVSAIFHRVGFSNYEVFEEYSEAEVQWVNNECGMTLSPWLNTFPGLVVNRPTTSGSNASKPYQITLIGQHGFLVPTTIVTNLPTTARTFYEDCGGEVIFKSISYHRSIVQKMKEEDFDRIDALQHCPVQLQVMVPGFDVRVHVVGSRGVFASRIESGASDYRYDKESDIVAYEIDDDLAQRCINLTAALGLKLSGIDLRVTPEGHVCCFEVNPSPAFAWYEARTGQPITACLVDYLQQGV